MPFIHTNRETIIELILWLHQESTGKMISVEDAESILDEFNNLKQ